jgi:hypothetical protein
VVATRSLTFGDNSAPLDSTFVGGSISTSPPVHPTTPTIPTIKLVNNSTVTKELTILFFTVPPYISSIANTIKALKKHLRKEVL